MTKKCKCGNVVKYDGNTWCPPCYRDLCMKWDNEIHKFLTRKEGK